MERFGGFLMSTIGAILTIWNWHLAFSDGHFYPHLAIISPTLIVIGFGKILFPTRLTTGHDRKETTLGWVVNIIAIGSGILNWVVLKGLY
jgi:hypothetical protein